MSAQHQNNQKKKKLTAFHFGKKVRHYVYVYIVLLNVDFL